MKPQSTEIRWPSDEQMVKKSTSKAFVHLIVCWSKDFSPRRRLVTTTETLWPSEKSKAATTDEDVSPDNHPVAMALTCLCIECSAGQERAVWTLGEMKHP